MFNPSHAAQHLDPNGVDALYDIKPLRYHKIMITGMKSVVHAYLTACVGVVVDTSSMEAFTNDVLLFWRRATATSSRRGRGRRAHHVRHDAKLGER